MTLAQLDQTLGSSELELWKAFYDLEPFGPPRDNWNVAVLCALTANINRGKNGKVMRPDDFMYTAAEIRKKQQSLEFLAFLESRSTTKHGK